ncbi:MAG: ribonuclease III [Alphaproteobacteria bacterium]
MSAAGDNRIAAAAAALDHRFTCPTLLAEALIHPSAQLRGASYERLEFLGDRVLGLVVAEMLYAAFPAEAEGALAKRFTALVRRETLTRIAADLDLGAFLRLSRGEEESGGRANPAVLADALEAVIGALFLDGGFAAAETFVRRHWSAPMAATDRPPEDAKSRLQEWAQGHGLALPVYTTVSSRGPSHSPTFEVEVRVEDQPPARATGATKRAAEQAAAAGLLAQMAGLKRRRPE